MTTAFKTIEKVLEHKGHDVWAIHPGATVLDAIQEFKNRNIGSLAVMENDKIVGIFTERQYARNVFLKGKASPTTPVREVMKTDVAYVTSEQSIPDCMAIMTANKIRHLPVMEGENVVGMVSIGDLVESTISDQKFTIEQLEHYISS